MQKNQPQQIKQYQEEKWQIYQPENEGKTFMKAFHVQLKNLLKLILASCVLYLIVNLISPLTIFVICALVATSVKLIKLKLAQIKRQGLASRLSPKLKQLLFEKSIFDIYSDILYFPLITKILGAFIKPILAKPHPLQLRHSFQQLPQSFQKMISRKGILNLAPERILQIVVDKSDKQTYPQNFGKTTYDWYNIKKYEEHHEKVHQNTIRKIIVQRIDDNISWRRFTLMTSAVAFGIFKMKPTRMKKMLIQNGSFLGILFVTLIALIKLKKIKDKMHRQKQEQRKIQAIKAILLDKDD